MLAMLLVGLGTTVLEATEPDPAENDEAKASLRLNGRTDADGNTYVFASRSEEQYLLRLVEFKAEEKPGHPGSITSACIEIYEEYAPSNVVWKMTYNRNCECVCPIPTPPDKWDNAGFYTRTNQANSTDFAQSPNQDSNHDYKFLDPTQNLQGGPCTFWVVKLTVNLAGGGRLVATDRFYSKNRTVAWSSEEDESIRKGKLWVWKTFNKHLGDEDVPSSENADSPYVFLKFPWAILNTAFNCVTPCAGSSGPRSRAGNNN